MPQPLRVPVDETTTMIPYASSRGRGVLLAAVLGSGMAFLDGTVVNVALPALGRELHAQMTGLQWTVDAYLLSLSAFLLLGGALGDRFGRRRIFVAGIVWFAVASALCGFAPSVEVLIAARVFQGMGAALLVPTSLALLRGTIEPEDQGRAIGAWSGLSGVTTALGPLFGGWLVDAASWRYIFYVNLPLAAAATWAALRFVPKSERRSRTSLDVGGAVLAGIALTGMVYALIEAPRQGWAGPSAVAAAVGVAALAAFLVLEHRLRHPMLPLGLFRSRGFTGANLTTLAVYFGLGGATFLLSLQLQQRVGYSALAAGAALTPITVMMLLLSPRAGSYASKHGPRLLMTVGPVIAAAGLALLSRVAPGTSYLRGVLPGVALLGLGLSATVAPLTATALESVEERLAGVASGVNNMVARVAGLLAVALLPGVGSFANGTLVSAALCLAGGLVSFLLLPKGRARG